MAKKKQKRALFGVKVREMPPGSGKWGVQVNRNGLRKSQVVGDKRAANKVASDWRAEIAEGNLGILEKKLPTLAAYGKNWLEKESHRLAETSVVTYQAVWKYHIKPYLGNKRLNEIKRRHIRELIETLKSEGLGSARIQTVLAVLSSIFKRAVDDDILAANPATRQGGHVGSKPKKESNPLTADEIAVLFKKAEARETRPVLITLYLLLVRTGLRIGEALALEWADIDFDERTAEIKKSWRYSTRTMGPPKNGKNRRVDLTPNVVDALKELRKEEKILSITGCQIIFSDFRGRRLQHYEVYRTLQKVSPRPIRIHDLRHTYVTLRVAKGDNIVDVSNQLGHHDPGFTLKRYAKWMPGKHKAQVDDLDNVAPICKYNES